MSRQPHTLLAALAALLAAGTAHAQVQLNSQQWREQAEKRYGKPTRKGSGLGATAALGAVTTVGSHPEGFGKTAFWDRKGKVAVFVVFVNPADSLGVCIANLRKGDVVEVTSATGICSFSKGRGKLISSLVGIAATAGVALAPKAAPFIKAGEKFARENFGQSTRGEPRDPFGRNPENGDYARDEGGVLVCLPGAGGVYYQGAGRIKAERPRHDNLRPDHVKHGFFLVQGDRKHNTRVIDQDGELYLLAWDSRFDDNQGYYKVMLRVRRR